MTARLERAPGKQDQIEGYTLNVHKIENITINSCNHSSPYSTWNDAAEFHPKDRERLSLFPRQANHMQCLSIQFNCFSRRPCGRQCRFHSIGAVPSGSFQFPTFRTRFPPFRHSPAFSPLALLNPTDCIPSIRSPIYELPINKLGG